MSIQKLDFNYVRQAKKSFTSFLSEVLQHIDDGFVLGVFCYLSSLPQDWIVNKQHLMNHFKVGRKKIGDTLKWLNDHYLLEYEQERTADGTFGACGIVIKDGVEFLEKMITKKTESSNQNTALPKNDTADVTALPENRTTEKPQCGEIAPTYNTKLTKNKKKRERGKTASPPPRSLSDFFPDNKSIEFCHKSNIDLNYELSKFKMYAEDHKWSENELKTKFKWWLIRAAEHQCARRN